MSAFGCNISTAYCDLLTPSALTELNSNCYCLPIDRKRVETIINSEQASAHMPALLANRPHYFASTAVFVSGTDVRTMQDQITAIENVVRLPAYHDAVWAHRPDAIYKAQPDTQGAFMSYDFHMSPNGPRLIEINSNAGGAFIANALQRTIGQSSAGIEQRIYDMFQTEWTLAGHAHPLQTIAIVDENPREQFHYPDMCLAAKLFTSNGLNVVITDPRELHIHEGRLFHKRMPIDLVYNRSTDFALETPQNNIIRQALRDDLAVVTPAPRHHALFADKHNLIGLSDAETLAKWGASEVDIRALKTIPETQDVTPENAAHFWTQRRDYFFKPATGFGSRGSYRGAKLTRKTWAHIRKGGYVAQRFIAPPLRAITDGHTQAQLKFDVRIYTYDGAPLLLAARMYQGQTTNMRTQGGGLAPVITVGGPARL